MAEDAILPVLQKIQERLGSIEKTLGTVQGTLAEMRSEMDGQFQLMMSRGAKADGLEQIVAALGRRVTALERR